MRDAYFPTEQRRTSATDSTTKRQREVQRSSHSSFRLAPTAVLAPSSAVSIRTDTVAMEPSPAALPQLSSYLPAPSSDTRTSTTAVTTTSCGAAKKRRNSIEGAYSAVSPRPPTPHQPEDDQRKRKQSPSDVTVETKDNAPFSRLNSIYLGQGLGGLQVSETVSPSSTCPAIHDGDSTSAADVQTTRYFASQSPTPRRERTSRYLSESDRREIITRIDGGEKQVTLAREFSVSRAAICNLYKNRWEVLTREGRNPESKHPKKSRGKRSSPRLPSQPAANAEQIMVPEPTTGYPDVSTISISEDESPRGDQEKLITPSMKDRVVQPRQDENESNPASKGSSAEASARVDSSERQKTGLQQQHNQEQQDEVPRSHYDVTGSSPVASKPFLVHEASAHSYPCRNLIAALRDVTISTVVFQQRATRLVRLLVEEALICLPHEEVEIKNQFGDVCHASKTLDERDICGVSMEDKGMVLLRAFSSISPTSPTGVVSLAPTTTSDDVKRESMATPTIHAQLPPVGPRQAVLLLDIQCSTGNEACAVLHYLVHERRIAASSIYFVTVISSFEGLQNVFRHFPDVTLIAAQVDTVLDVNQRIRPGIGDFMQRYWNVHADPGDRKP